MAQKNTTLVGAAYSIVEATTMLTDDRKGSPVSGVFSRKQEKTHSHNDIESQVSMRACFNRYNSKEDSHA